jgi:hypothetical protein
VYISGGILLNQGSCGAPVPTPSITPTISVTPTQSPVSFIAVSVRLSNATNTICSAGALLRYTNDGTIITGNELRTAGGSPVTGFSYVVAATGGIIYELNPVTGLIGADSGDTC